MSATWRLLGPAVARDLHLDRGGRESACTGRPASAPASRIDAAHVAEDQGAAGVDGMEDVLDGEDVGARGAR